MRTFARLSSLCLVALAGVAAAAPLSQRVFKSPAEAARQEGVDTMGRWLRTKLPASTITVTQIGVSPGGRSTRHLVAGAKSSMQVSVLATKAGFRAFDTRNRKYVDKDR